MTVTAPARYARRNDQRRGRQPRNQQRPQSGRVTRPGQKDEVPAEPHSGGDGERHGAGSEPAVGRLGRLAADEDDRHETDGDAKPRGRGGPVASQHSDHDGDGCRQDGGDRRDYVHRGDGQEAVEQHNADHPERAAQNPEYDRSSGQRP